MFDPNYTSTKYTFVCDPDECDTLVEMTTSDRFGFPSGTVQHKCSCGRQMSYLGSTIESNPTTERQQMNDTPLAPIEMYNPNGLTTYKKIENGEASYPSIKTVDLEYALAEKERITNQFNTLRSTVNRIIDNLSADNWYDSNTDKSEILAELCELLDHEPKQTIRMSATVSVEVEYDIPLDELEDFDARYFLQDNLSIDAFNGDVIVDSFDVEDARVDY